MLTLLRREITSLALWPATYLISGAYILISGIIFIDLVSSRDTADLAPYYANTVTTLLFLCPIFAARALADERASGALTVSLAWPISRTALVLSKFIAITLMTWLLISVSWIYYFRLDALAEPEYARVLGGWIGLLLLSAMFNGIALAVSSRMGTAVGAAFLSFVVLLFLRLIQLLPANLRDNVDQFSPLEWLDPMLDGVLPAEDVAYFLVFALASLSLAVYSLGRRGATADRQMLVRRGVGFTGAVAFVLATPAVAGAVSGEADLTPGNRETVSDATRELLELIGDVEIELTAFSPSVSLEASKVRSTVRKYEAGGANISGRIIDPDISPALARSSGVIAYNDYLLRVGERTKEIDDLVESTLTTAIAELARQERPLACFIEGHGERRINNVGPDGMTSLAARLRIIGLRTGTVFLAAKGADQLLNEECDVVLLMGPRSTMPPADFNKLKSYLANNGRLIVAADSVRGDLDQINELVAPYGLRFLPGELRDPQSLADDPGALVSAEYASSSEVVDVLNNDDTPVVFSNTLAIDKAGPDSDEGPQLGALVQSSPRAYRVDENNKRLPDSLARYTIAGFTFTADRENPGEEPRLMTTRIGLLGTPEAATNLYQKSYGNQELMVKLIQYIAGEDTIISAYREVGESSQFQITKAQRNDLIRQTVVLPTLAALVFVPFALWRLRRG